MPVLLGRVASGHLKTPVLPLVHESAFSTVFGSGQRPTEHDALAGIPGPSQTVANWLGRVEGIDRAEERRCKEGIVATINQRTAAKASKLRTAFVLLVEHVVER